MGLTLCFMCSSSVAVGLYEAWGPIGPGRGESDCALWTALRLIVLHAWFEGA